MMYRNPELEQKLVDIANKKGDWQTRAPNVCRLALARITELENAWANMRDAAQAVEAAVCHPQDQ